jgi:hypothetical protein
LHLCCCRCLAVLVSLVAAHLDLLQVRWGDSCVLAQLIMLLAYQLASLLVRAC